VWLCFAIVRAEETATTKGRGMYVPRDHDKRRATGKVKWPDMAQFLQEVSKIFGNRYQIRADRRVRETFDETALPSLLQTIQRKYDRNLAPGAIGEHMTFGQLYNQLSGR
jgi:hypothetical protein